MSGNILNKGKTRLFVNSDPNGTTEITGSGTANTIPKFTAAQIIGNSNNFDDGTYTYIGAADRFSVRQSDGRIVAGIAQGSLGAGFSHSFASTTVGAGNYAFTVSTAGFSAGRFLIYNSGAFEIGDLSGPAAVFAGDGVNSYSFTGSTPQKVGINIAPTAQLTLGAGATAASSAPLKFTSGSLNTSAEVGAVEFLTDTWYGTITTGTTRKAFAFTDITINSQSDSYTLILSDSYKLIEMTKGTANNLTVPLNSSVAYPIGTQILLYQSGAGQVTVVATGGVTINSVGGALKTFAQYSTATLIKTGTNTWLLTGSITT